MPLIRVEHEIKALLQREGHAWAAYDRLLDKPAGWFARQVRQQRLHALPERERGRVARFVGIDPW